MMMTTTLISELLRWLRCINALHEWNYFMALKCNYNKTPLAVSLLAALRWDGGHSGSQLSFHDDGVSQDLF